MLVQTHKNRYRTGDRVEPLVHSIDIALHSLTAVVEDSILRGRRGGYIFPKFSGGIFKIFPARGVYPLPHIPDPCSIPNESKGNLIEYLLCSIRLRPRRQKIFRLKPSGMRLNRLRLSRLRTYINRPRLYADWGGGRGGPTKIYTHL